ncbi:hypothetical protein BDQ17DRAFT_1392732 [Cyathus striatus]|nr:hypothetical protein BDQ17DRAFT_1392732 [Cyathus striatus]
MSTIADPRTATSQVITLPNIPELFNPNFLDILLPPTNHSSDTKLPNQNENPPAPPNAMIEALKLTGNRTYTENRARAYNSTGSPLLDAFQLLNSYLKRAKIARHLSKAWMEDPSLTLKIIWNLRSIHDGKGDKRLFYRAFGWLYDNHPRTAISNLHLLVEPQDRRSHGYWKDLLNILCLATRRELHDADPTFLDEYKIWRSEQRAGVYDQLVRRLNDPKYRALYIAIARLFAERLSTPADRIPLLREISLAGKWAPTPGKSHDCVYNISTAIAQLVHSSEALKTQPKALSGALNPRDKALILRSVYQRWVLTELRKVIPVPETLMSANRWSEISYSRVPSTCMHSNNMHFFRHDPEGFQRYLLEVEKGKVRISGATLMPHKLVKKAVDLAARSAHLGNKYPLLVEPMNELKKMQMRVVEAQWKTLIERLKASGVLENSIAICDTSGSMGLISDTLISKHDDVPIFPAIALSLIIAHLSKPPFNAGFITFSATHEFVQLDLSKSLDETVYAIHNAEWGMNTDFNAVFLKLLLPLAIKNNVKQEDMIKRLFVFSDVQFDEEAGYEVPEIVFWDMSEGERTVEVSCNRRGVAMMNGFSPAMLKVFMGEGEEVGDKKEFNPVNVMMRVLVKESFGGLVVVD